MVRRRDCLWIGIQVAGPDGTLACSHRILRFRSPPTTQRPLTFFFPFTRSDQQGSDLGLTNSMKERWGGGSLGSRWRQRRGVSLPAAGLSLLGSLCGRGGALGSAGSPTPHAGRPAGERRVVAKPARFSTPNSPSHAVRDRAAVLSAECCSAASFFPAALPSTIPLCALAAVAFPQFL